MNGRRFWPVIHTDGYDQAARNVALSAAAGAHGVFLINMTGPAEELADTVVRLRSSWPDGLALGVNLLGVTNTGALTVATRLGCDAYWTDHVRPVASPLRRRLEDAPDWFGGVAHKGNPHVADADLPATMAAAAATISVPTMTGPGTGQVSEPHRYRLAREGLPTGHRLAVASGLTPENVHHALPFVTDYLAATGISSSFYDLDPARTASLARAVADA